MVYAWGQPDSTVISFKKWERKGFVVVMVEFLVDVQTVQGGPFLVRRIYVPFFSDNFASSRLPSAHGDFEER